MFEKATFAEELSQLNQSTFTKKDTRDLVRLLTNEAQDLSPDTAGRVQLPEYLINFAQLKKDVVIVGSLSRVEIWDRDRYHSYISELEPQAEELAERFDRDRNPSSSNAR